MILAVRIFRASVAFFHGIATAPNYVFLNIWDWFWSKWHDKHLVLFVGMMTIGALLAAGAGFLAIFLGLLLGWHLAAQKLKGDLSEIEIRW